MRTVQVINRTRGEVLAEHAEVASSIWTRFWGLMGQRDLPTGGGMVFQPGGAIHTCFMRIPIDVLHINGQDRVTHVLRALPPWRFGPLFVGGHRTVELPAGAASATQPGDEIAIMDDPRTQN